MTADESGKSKRGEIVTALNSCIETCTDGEKGYAIAAADVRDLGLKAYFQGKAEERADFVVALQEAVAALEATPENEGSAAGALHRGLVGVRKAIEGRSDKLLVEECLRGEVAALAKYDAALGHVSENDEPTTLRALLVHQQEILGKSIAELRRRLGGMG
jgi:uncharacterized protein (TIGR02284 family)